MWYSNAAPPLCLRFTCLVNLDKNRTVQMITQRQNIALFQKCFVNAYISVNSKPDHRPGRGDSHILVAQGIRFSPILILCPGVGVSNQRNVQQIFVKFKSSLLCKDANNRKQSRCSCTIFILLFAKTVL